MSDTGTQGTKKLSPVKIPTNISTADRFGQIESDVNKVVGQSVPFSDQMGSGLNALGRAVDPKSPLPTGPEQKVTVYPETPNETGNRQSQTFDLQGWLNQQLKPYNDQLSGIIKDYQQTNASMIQPWMPANIRPAIANLQKLTGQALNNLMPAELKTQESYVQNQDVQELEQLLPSSLIYHTLEGSLPNLPKGPASGGIQDLWTLFQHINAGETDPAGSNSSTDFNNFLQQLPIAGLSGTPDTSTSQTG